MIFHQYATVQCPLYFIPLMEDYGGGSHSLQVNSDRMRSAARLHMRSESPQLELERLRRYQAKARADEVFGGLSTQERSAYDLRQDRIHELEHDLSEPGEARPRNRDLVVE